MEIRVYTTNLCPDCKRLKTFLEAGGVAFEEVDISTAEALTELRMNGVFTLMAPVLQVGSVFLTHPDLFTEGTLHEERIRELINSFQGSCGQVNHPSHQFGEETGAAMREEESFKGRRSPKTRWKHEKKL